jgi:citrate synthase
MEKLFIIHAEHEINCSTATMRMISSTLVDPYSAIAGAAAALYGPLHGGANEAVLKMFKEIQSVDRIPMFLESVKRKECKLMGFGHRVYKSYDPRAKLVKEILYEVVETCGCDQELLKIAEELERQALEDEYFSTRRLYPNVDYYSGLVFKAMGFPVDFFPLLFAIPRISGWLAHWREQLMMDGD